ncbi:hypothetical protein ACHAXS_004524 [Conticribra weissflogii]
MNRRSEEANNALTFLILINLFVFIFRNDFHRHLNIGRTYRIYDGDISSMILSMFYHIEPGHLFVNMLALHRYGSELFVNTSSKRWRSFFIVLLSYLVCGIAAFIGIELLSNYHEYQWNRRVHNARFAKRCNHWICDSINDVWGEDISSYFTNAWADWATTLANMDIKLSMWHFKLIYRIGASGVVYGWMGMRLLTSWMSPHHSRLSTMDYFFLIGTLAHDLSMSPVSLEDLRMSVFLEGDGIDHSAHFLGACFGFLWAFILILWERIASFSFGGWGWGWRGQGRRLGERWEDEEILRQREQQRREQSRLLNPTRTHNNRERTML